jgi:hypothetical protein
LSPASGARWNFVDDAMARYGDFAARIEEFYYEQRMAELLAEEG